MNSRDIIDGKIVIPNGKGGYYKELIKEHSSDLASLIVEED